ncbi:molybdopterin-dependent oxidoreductase [Pseudonocardia spirodelae]|uniref:Molybdopterin-dependent oxidoreductase n=1 Tax=Pseudonocardia spirodelae TaxID=3133431 RepID=A0ABU8T9G2_9PSEU
MSTGGPAAPVGARTPQAGLAAAALGVGAGQAVALLVAPSAGPVAAVAGQVVALTPPALAGAATVGAGVGSRGTVVAGVLVVLTLAAAGSGALSARTERPGTWGLAVLGLLGVAAAVTASGAGQLDVVPASVALLVAVTAFRRLHRLAARIPALTPAGTLPDGRPARASLTRRRFLRTTALAGAGGVALGAGAAVAAPLLPSGRLGPARAALTARLRDLAARGRIAAAPALPAGAQVAGAAAFTTPVEDFYRIDTALRVPAVDPATWSLRVHGRVGRELTLTLDDLLAAPLVERWVTMACVSNDVGGDLVSTTRFTGVELAPLLARAAPDPAADQALSTSSDGWTAGSPSSLLLDPARGALLALGMAGPDGPVALPPEHGFPVRIVVPGLYGYVSATKWVTGIEFTTFAGRADYWRARGWDPPGPMETASRIESPSSYASVPAGRVVVTGTAWAVPRGISRVEVGTQGGPWVDAELAPVPAGGATWRQWRAELDLVAGGYTLLCRATDGDGVVQTGQRRSPLPGAATGWPSRSLTVT